MTYLELARRQKGWSQKVLGEHPRVRIHQVFISLTERGLGLPTADQRARLARVLGVPAEHLLATVPEGTEPGLPEEKNEASGRV